MRIDDNLRLVLRPDDDMVVYHTPINADVFNAYYRLLAYTRANLAAEGLQYQMGAGPRISAKILRDKAIADALAAGDVTADGTGSTARAAAFFAELERLTMIATVAAGNWQPHPAADLIRANAARWDEVLNQLVFFTCHSALALSTQRHNVMEATALVLGASLTSLPLTAYLASLPTSTPVAGGTAAASSATASDKPPAQASMTSSTSTSSSLLRSTARASG